MLIKSNDPYLLKLYKREKKNWKEQERKTGKRVWNKYVKLYSKRNFFPLTAKRLINNGISGTIYEVPQDTKDLNIIYNGELRDYQKEIVNKVVEQQGGLIDSKTGTGKSHVIMGIIQAIPKRTMIVVPTTKLLLEMKEKFEEFTNITPGVFYGKKKETDKNIVIITRQSFTRGYTWYDNERVKNNWRPTPVNFMKQFGGPYHTIIVDECDAGVSETFINAITESGAEMLVGLTGTPHRPELDTTDLEFLYGKRIEGGDYQELPDALIQVEYRWDKKEEHLARIQAMSLEKVAWDYHTLLNVIEKNNSRKEKIKEFLIETIRKRNFTMLLFERVEHAKERAKIMEEEGFDLVLYHGKLKKKEEEEAIKKIKQFENNRDKGKLIVATIHKMGRGVDIPAVDTVILYSKVKFKSAVIQAFGRALRPSDKKSSVVFITINDSLLKGQRFEQRKTFIEEYTRGIYKPQIINVVLMKEKDVKIDLNFIEKINMKGKERIEKLDKESNMEKNLFTDYKFAEIDF